MAALLLSACGSQTPATPCAAYAQAYCGKQQSCASGLFVRNWGDMGTCVTRETLACTNTLAAPSTGKTVELVEQCTAGMPSYLCSDFLDGNLPAACNPTGPGAAGAACTYPAQCASGFCAGNRYALCGTCAAPPAVGDSCATGNCDHNQSCVTNAALDSICEPYVASGAACGANGDPLCAADLTCAGASTTTGVGGICQPAIEIAGTTCGTKNMGLGCDSSRGLWCTAKTGATATCSNVMYVGDGVPCGYVSDGVVAQCKSGTCYTAAGPFFTFMSANSIGVCKAYAADGAACDSATGPECLAPARCITNAGTTAGACTLLAPALTATCQ